MNPLEIVSAGVGLLGNLIGGFHRDSVNLQQTRETNAANLQIARENNQKDIDLFNAGNEFTEGMWNKQNVYNDPAAVRARLIRAGISPSAMADSALASSVSSLAPPKMTSPEMKPYQMIESPLSTIGGSINDFFQNQLIHAQSQSVQADVVRKGVENQFVYEDKMADLRERMQRIINSNLDAKRKKVELGWLEKEKQQLYSLNEKNMSLVDAQYDNAIATGREINARKELIDAQTAETIRQTTRLDEESAQKIASMRQQDAVAWFRAQNDEKVSLATIEKLTSEKTLNDLLYKREEAIDGFKREMAELSRDQQKAVAAVLAAEAARKGRESMSQINNLMQMTFGIGLSDILGTATDIAGTAAMVAK